MRQTDNLALNLPEGADNYNKDDYNANFEIIDDKIKKIETAMEELGNVVVCEIDFTESDTCKITGRRASCPNVDWTFQEESGVGLKNATGGIQLPVTFDQDKDTIIELEVSGFTHVSSGTLQSLFALGDGYEDRGIGWDVSNSCWYAKNSAGIIRFTDATEVDIFNGTDGGIITLEINRFGLCTLYDSNGNEVLRQYSNRHINDGRIFIGGHHSNTYGSIRNLDVKSVKVSKKLSPDLLKNDLLVYGYTAESNYIENAAPVLTLDEGENFSEFLTYDATTKKFTVQNDFEGFVILDTYNYRSANSDPQGALYYNDTEVMRLTNLGYFGARAAGARFQMGQRFTFTSGENIYPYNPGSGGYALENIYIYKLN